MNYVYDAEFIRSQKNQNVIIESLQTDMGTAQADITTLQNTKGDTISPAANTADYIPQWDGADSKTLKNGLALDTDGTLAANSDTKIPSQKAVKTYADTKIAKSAICGSSFSATVAAGETKYFSFGAGTAYEPSLVIPTAGAIKNLRVYTSNAPGSGKNVVFTIMQNGSASALTATLTTGNYISDTAHTVSVSAGDRLVLRAVASAGATTNAVQFSFEFDPS